MGGKVELGFHGSEQLFGDLFGAADAGFGAFYIGGPNSQIHLRMEKLSCRTSGGRNGLR